MSEFLSGLRREALDAPPSGIVEVFDHGRGRQGLIPLWVGEGDLPTPEFIRAAASRALEAGETFYTWQAGIPDLRAALARYHERVYGGAFAADRFFVTGSGMQAIQIAFTMLAGPGDEVIVPSPAWPNVPAAVGIRGARAVEVAMAFGPSGWTLDIDRIAAAVTPATRVIAINSPSNPTGWTASREELAAILAIARRHGLWVLADEVYGRFVWDGSARAPSFHDVAEPEDRVLYVNTFSKNWAMTGWRVGWIEAPRELGPTIENLIQYSTSGVAAFLQRGAVVALDEGEPFIAHQIERMRESRAILAEALAGSGRARFAPAAGAFYAFFGIEGEPDSRALAFRLIDEAGVGLAPGSAFGAAGDGFLRLCWARGPESIRAVAERLGNWLTKSSSGP